MRLVTYRSERGERAGVLRDEEIVDAWDYLGGAQGAPSTRALIEQGRVIELAALTGDERAAAKLGPGVLAAPITDPGKIICIGLNYRAHAEEAGLEPPAVPTFFAKFANNALAADGETVKLPTASEKCDYEAEIAFVVGRRASEVAAEEALDHVAGYTLFNDLSARDLQFATPQWMPGKVFDGSAPLGPAIVTPDEAGPPDEIELALDLNGRRMQQARSDDLVFGVADLVSHLSRWMTLEPGDVIATGTPAGVGSTRDPRVWLGAGDEIVVSSPQLGELRTLIAR